MTDSFAVSSTTNDVSSLSTPAQDVVVVVPAKPSSPVERTPPEVRQCQNISSPLFGTVAVKTDVPGQAWALADPARGGSWSVNDDMVNKWPIMTSATSAPLG